MKTLKEKFEFSEGDKHWMNFPFVISNEQFQEINWLLFSKSFNKLSEHMAEIEFESPKACFEYAKTVNLFTADELDDMEFGMFDIELTLSNSEISSFIVSYGVEEDENSKIRMKDIYGIWKVYYTNYKIVNVVRE